MEQLEYARWNRMMPGEDESTIVLGLVVYKLFSDQRVCVFSGITKNTGSTVNYAESIIQRIQRDERIESDSWTFYDLQTWEGYNNPPGHFEYERLGLEIDGGRLHVTGWNHENCPAHIVRAFADHIGPNPYQQRHPHDYRPGAYEAWKQHEASLPVPKPRKLFPWVDLSYAEGVERFAHDLMEPYLRSNIPNPKFRGLLDALESCYASGLGRSSFVKVDRQLVQYLASWVRGSIEDQQADKDEHSFNNVLEGFIRTLVRAIRLNEIHLCGNHAFYNGFQLPDWFVGWAFTWHFTPGEGGDT